MKIHHGLIIILSLFFLSSASSFYSSFSIETASVYNRYSVYNASISHTRLIEMLLILMPISWIVIYTYLNFKSEKLGSSDFLTKLPNRRYLEKNKKKYDLNTTTIIYMDLDNLKKINDTISHKEGDKLIIAFTDKLKKICQKNSIFRVGGDEFIIFYKGKTEVFLTQLTHILKSDGVDSDSNRFSFSAGVVEAKHLDISTFDEAISIADYTMYKAKEKGKGNIILTTQEHVDEYRLTNYIKSHLEKACKSISLIPFFQPFIDGSTGKIKGFETLVRMKIGNGYAPNDHLIKQARELNLLKQIDTQMFEENLKFAKYLIDNGWADKTWIFNSNFSANTLSKIKLEDLYEMTKIYGISPEQVVIEITEDELLDKSIQTFLQNYKKYNFKIAIDDFGAAYSSFVRLLEVKPDIMKIDRSLLTMDISSNSDVKNLYNNMIHLGRDLNSTITAEGVENTDQMALLQSLGVETLQGFHFSKPLPKEEFIEFLLKHV